MLHSLSMPTSYYKIKAIKINHKPQFVSKLENITIDHKGKMHVGVL